MCERKGPVAAGPFHLWPALTVSASSRTFPQVFASVRQRSQNGLPKFPSSKGWRSRAREFPGSRSRRISSRLVRFWRHAFAPESAPIFGLVIFDGHLGPKRKKAARSSLAAVSRRAVSLGGAVPESPPTPRYLSPSARATRMGSVGKRGDWGRMVIAHRRAASAGSTP